MASISPVLEILKASSNPCADDVLVEGLTNAEPAFQQQLVETILERKRKDGLVGLVGVFHQLPSKLQNAVLDRQDALFGVLRLCVKSRDAQTRQNALEIIGRTGSYRLAYLLSLALHDSHLNNRERAAQILRMLADRYFRQERVTLQVLRSGPLSGSEQSSVQAYSLARLAEERSYLISAITEAVNNYDVHKRVEIAELVLWFAQYLSGTLWKTIGNRRSGCSRAILDLIEGTRDPRVAPFLYQALGHQDLRPTATRLLTNHRDDAFMEAFVRHSFLVADAKVRRGVASIRLLSWLGRGSRSVLELEPELYPRAVSLVLATGMPVERKVAVLRDMLLSGRSDAQWAALWGLIDIDHEMSTQLIRTVARWEDEEMAAVAIREMMRRCPEDLTSLMADQIGSDSASLRAMADEQISEFGFEHYWMDFDAMPEEDRFTLGKALVQRSPDVLPSLRSKLNSNRPSDRLRAVQIVSVLDIARDLDEDIYRIAYDADNYVRASVVSLLSELPGPTSERILLNALNDTDDRVQANAIESLEALRLADHTQQIRELLNSQDNRVRANAVKALLSVQSREAGVILLEMLHDADPNRRVSALWVVESLKLMTLAARVLKLAKFDPDDAVRRRALRAVSVLHHALKDQGADEGAGQTASVGEVAS